MLAIPLLRLCYAFFTSFQIGDPMLPDCYFGAYARFGTTSKKDAAILLGSNCIIGDVFNIEFKP